MSYLILSMSFFFFFSLIHAKESNFEILQEFESFYEAIAPAHEKNNETFVWFSDIPHPLFNAVMHLSCGNVKTKVDELMENAPPAAPVSFWIHPENHAEGLVKILEERGFKLMITCPLMAWDVESVPPFESDIRPANEEIFYEIISNVYQLDQIVINRFQRLMAKTDCENYLLYLGEDPVSTGTLFVKDSFGGIFNDATLPERRESNRSMMQFFMLRAHDLKLKKLIVLSSPEAEDLYSNLGFKNIFNIDIYWR